MDTNIVLVDCLCDDLLKWQHHRNDSQCMLSDAEIMTIAIVAAMYFHGNQAMAHLFLSELKTMLFVLASSIFAIFGQKVATWVTYKTHVKSHWSLWP
jgi:hypothetical protein